MNQIDKYDFTPEKQVEQSKTTVAGNMVYRLAYIHVGGIRTIGHA